MLVMDGSGSMARDDASGTPKIEAAKDAVQTLVEDAPPTLQIGLRVFGGRVAPADQEKACRDTRLIFGVGEASASDVAQRVERYEAGGKTPIAESLRLAADDLPGTGKRQIILVSDGADTCAPPEPCDVARQLAQRGVSLKVQVVGFNVAASEREQLECIARVTGGVYRDAADAEQLARELRALATRAARSYDVVGEPLRGGRDARSAASARPGQYVDSLRAGEERWYAVEVGAGQAPAAAATLVPPARRGARGLGATRLTVDLMDARGRAVGGSGSAVETNLFLGQDGDIESLGVFGRPVGSRGQWRVRVAIRDTATRGLDESVGGQPFALELLLSALGRERVAAARGGSNDGDEGGGSSVVVLLVIVALAVLCAVGFLAVLRRRRRERP